MREQDYVYEGQLTVYDCIRVAETGADGRPTTQELNERSTMRPIPDTPQGRAEAVRDGRISIPLACPTCNSPAVESSAREGTHCVTCGRDTNMTLVRAHRRRRVRTFLENGVL